MQLVIKDGRVFAWHRDHQDILGAYGPEYEIVPWDGPAPQLDEETHELPLDPRPEAQRQADAAQAYQIARRREYPPWGDQLDMIYWDRVNGTNQWEELITRIKQRHPKLGV